MPKSKTPTTLQSSKTYDWTAHTTATCGTCPENPGRHSPPTGYPTTRHTRTETNSTTTPHQSNNQPPHWASRRTASSYDALRTPLYPPQLRTPPSMPAKTPAPTRPRADAGPQPTVPMVRTPLHPHPRRVHQMHLRPHKGQNLGPLQDMPPVPGARQPHGLEPSPHHCTTRRMANTVPDNPKAPGHPSAGRGAQASPQEAHPHCGLHPAKHPRG